MCAFIARSNFEKCQMPKNVTGRIVFKTSQNPKNSDQRKKINTGKK